MIRPLLIIGVGGSGGKTIRAMKQELFRILESSGYSGGIPDAWQFLQIDTTHDGVGFPAPMLSPQEFHCVVPSGASYKDVLLNVTSRCSQQEQQSLLAGWAIPAPTIPINTSPRQYRAIGRLVGLAGLSKMLEVIVKSISNMTSPTAQFEIEKIASQLGGKRADLQPQVLIFSSLGGGTGSGVFLDVAEIIKRSTSSAWGNNATTFLFAPDVFKSFGTVNKDIPKNALGAMNELIASQWNDVSEQTENHFLSVGLPNSFHSGGRSYRSSANYLVDISSIRALSEMTDLDGATADELLASFAIGFANELITGKFEFYSYIPFGQFTPTDELFVDKSGLMPEILAHSIVDSLPAYRFHPFWSLSSLTEPILEEVAKSNNHTQTWVQFWDGCRSRPLVEAVPFETEIRRSIITGWFLAGFFGLRETDRDRRLKLEKIPRPRSVGDEVKSFLASKGLDTEMEDPHEDERNRLNSFISVAGRSLRIWNPTLETSEWSKFPSPLLNSHPEDIKRDSWLLPQLLMSAGIALAQFGKSGNPEFINGYRLLKFLGREVTTSFKNRDLWDGNGTGDMLPNGLRAKSTYIENWLKYGTMPDDKMELSNSLQKNLTANPDRKAALISSIETLQSSYQEIWKEYDGVPFDQLPETWELREEIDLALSNITEYVRGIKATTNNPDDL